MGKEILPGPRLTHHTPERIDLHEAHALTSAELRLVFLLEAALPHLLPCLVALILGRCELLLRDLAHVADERRDRGPGRIVALGRRLNDEPGELDAMLLQHRHDIERRIGEHHGRPVGRASVAAHRRFDLIGVERDESAQALQRRAQRIGRGAEQ